MSVSVKDIAPSAVALAGHQRGGLLESLSRVLPSGLARRVLAAADADRQRIERDLHDGVQQRLTGLRIRLAVAAESFQERGWPLTRDLRTERDYTAAFRTPGPAQPQNGDPPAIEPLRTPTSAASRHNPGSRDKATSAAGGDASSP
jgi:hypothetical protein